MPTIKLNQSIEFDFEDYTYGNTFTFDLDFYEDDKFTIPQDVTGWSFVMDIKKIEPNCHHQSLDPESLTIGHGIEFDPVTNRIVISKVLVSGPGMYNQSITGTDMTGKITTWEKGTLKIDEKI